MNPPRTILAATDFGAIATHAVDYAADLAAALDAELILVNVYQVPPSLMPGEAGVAAELALRIPREAERLLAETLERVARPKLRARGVLKEGDAREGILAAARSERADLIVMGTHGRRGISRALIGSVAESALREAPCPVLTVHVDS
jgi:nucleotide-binding universal stress UspA family protein